MAIYKAHRTKEAINIVAGIFGMRIVVVPRTDRVLATIDYANDGRVKTVLTAVDRDATGIICDDGTVVETAMVRSLGIPIVDDDARNLEAIAIGPIPIIDINMVVDVAEVKTIGARIVRHVDVKVYIEDRGEGIGVIVAGNTKLLVV